MVQRKCLFMIAFYNTMDYSVRLACLSLLLTGFLHGANSETYVDVIPTEISPGLTNSLVVNCTYSTGLSKDMTALISMILSRANDSSGDFQELAAASKYAAKTVSRFTNESITATGKINASGESYLQVEWNYPTSLQAGVYRCLATGVDHIGHTVTNAEQATINSTAPDTENLLETIRLLHVYLNKNNAKMTSIAESVNKKLLAISQEIKKLALSPVTTNITDNVLQTCLDKMMGSLFLPPLTYGHREYYISKHSFTNMNEALATCELFGGSLAEIHTTDEYNALVNFCDRNVFDDGVLVSGTDEDVEGTWVFGVNQEPLPVHRWAPGEPNDGRSYNCLALWRAEHWKMVHHPCYDSMFRTRFICEIIAEQSD